MHPGIKIQTGTHLATSEKTWPTKIRALKFPTYFKFEHYWQNVRASHPGSSFPSCFHISQFLPFAVSLPQISFHWDCSAQTHKWYGNHWWKPLTRYYGYYGKIDSGKITILTALDMSAAFDTLDHTTLLHRLQHTFGLSGYVISWIRSYLTNRTSFVKIDSSSSPNTTICTGVPQGSVLGPLLFVLFISPVASVINPDLSDTSNIVSFHQYADDTQLYIGTNMSTLAHQVASIESCTQRVHSWLLNNGLHLNSSKYEAIAFFNPRSMPLESLAESITFISVAGSPIKLQSSIKNLGGLSRL